MDFLSQLQQQSAEGQYEKSTDIGIVSRLKDKYSDELSEKLSEISQTPIVQKINKTADIVESTAESIDKLGGVYLGGKVVNQAVSAIRTARQGVSEVTNTVSEAVDAGALQADSVIETARTEAETAGREAVRDATRTAGQTGEALAGDLTEGIVGEGGEALAGESVLETVGLMIPGVDVLVGGLMLGSAGVEIYDAWSGDNKQEQMNQAIKDNADNLAEQTKMITDQAQQSYNYTVSKIGSQQHLRPVIGATESGVSGFQSAGGVF
tara:strand:+ start:457 stop:1254 length:798 start_codon:yes stop_codon:yes gene_type:complete